LWTNYWSGNNCISPNRKPHQFGRTALVNIEKATNRIIEKGIDATELGRVWVCYKGRTAHTLRIFSAYWPNALSGITGPVYALQRLYFNTNSDDRCPCKAIPEDIRQNIKKVQAKGDHIIVMLDGNDDIMIGDIRLHDAIMNKHDTNAQPVYQHNKSKVP
jgi:hypothetical protein